MEQSEHISLIHKTIGSIGFFFKYLGFNISIREKTRAEKIKSRFIFICNNLWHNTDLCGEVFWFFMGIAQSKSFIELTYVAPCITISFLGNVKSIYLLVYENDAKKLIEILSNMEIERKSTQNEEQLKIMETEHNFVTRVIKILNIVYLVVLIGFALSPLGLIALTYYAKKEVKLELPFLIQYPFDSYDIHYWPWVYLHQIWSEFVGVGNNCVVDYLFYIFCTYIRTQFLLLKYSVENLITSNATSSIIDKEEIKLKVISFVKKHQELISCTEILEKMYTKSMLQNFVSSSILICLTGFNVMAISDIIIVITFLSFLFMSLFQIFFLCFFGDLLMAASMEVSDAAYNSRWYLADPSLAKYILLIQTRSQKPCKLTAYNFYQVNLKAFMKILSTAWSYFALLQTLYAPAAE